MKGTLNKKSVLLAGAAVLLSLVVFLLTRCGSSRKIPVLTVETPQKLSASQTETITLDVSVSELGETLYPAASMSIRFDPACLEFLGVEEGNVFVTSTSAPGGRMLPQWSCNPEQCNESGLINIMYLDLSGGTESFTKALLAEADNVVLQLSFRFRGSVRSGDVYDLIVEDAVFAASDETQSLAMAHNTLRAKNGKIVVGG